MLKATIKRLDGWVASMYCSTMTHSAYQRIYTHGGWQLRDGKSYFVNIGSGTVTMHTFPRELSRAERLSFNIATGRVREDKDYE